MDNNSASGQQNMNRAQEFEQKAQEAALGEQKARNFNAQNSSDRNNQQSQFGNMNQQVYGNQTMMNTTNSQQDWQKAQEYEQQAQQAAMGEQKADNFNAQNSDQ
ncbi:hypothetical protein [Desulfosporosinus sp. FKB]|uniref:hypothetical protein n=1 Tax=Desulfosporosinus sp. FKB TaxID=1969835 RepID=UPI000B4A4BDD|nr:hypothetical protein [Desulfosporosinus sp. FKB]